MVTLSSRTLKPIQLSALAISLVFNTAAIAATDSDNDIINGWQSSLAAEFVKLDTSGNGLLLPMEAYKGKAFNKKTFAAADVDGDGTIDQDEYINYRISMGATNQPANNVSRLSENNTGNASNPSSNNTKTISDEPVMNVIADNNTEMPQNSTEHKKSSVGGVIDDSIITTKAKAAIFNTPDLKTLQIGVKTRNGEVLLSGFVGNEAAKMKAEEVVKNVDGVKSIKNNLEVKT